MLSSCSCYKLIISVHVAVDFLTSFTLSKLVLSMEVVENLSILLVTMISISFLVVPLENCHVHFLLGFFLNNVLFMLW